MTTPHHAACVAAPLLFFRRAFMTTNEQRPWLTVEQGAERAQVGKKTLYGEVRAGRLRAARVGGRRELRFKAEWIDSWLEAAAPKEIAR